MSTGHVEGARSACFFSSRFVAESMMKTMPLSPKPIERARRSRVRSESSGASRDGRPASVAPTQKTILRRDRNRMVMVAFQMRL